MLIDPEIAAKFVANVRQNSINADLIDRLPELGLVDCWLVAGCVFQTVWNGQSGRPFQEHISDYDVFYCDASDLSYEAEDRHIKRLASAFRDIDARIELKNQARVHLWYRQRFGHDYPALFSTTQGIDRFLVACTCIGIRCDGSDAPAVYAHYGLDDLYAGMLRPNPLDFRENLFTAKALSYQKRWPWLKIDLSMARPS